MEFKHKDLLGMRQLSAKDIGRVLDTAESLQEISLRDIKKVPTLRGKLVVTLFFEPSTRTRMSFETAAKRLSADTLSLTASMSSAVKGESLIDTARNIQAMQPDLLILRHPATGAPHILGRELKAGVINAGDGVNEHPTQALLDLFTIREKKGRIEGLKVLIVGDISHSRVARSNILGLLTMGAEVSVSGPPTMMPACVETLGAKAEPNLRTAVEDKDVIMVLRIQLERQSHVLFPSLREYAVAFGITQKVMERARDNVLIMHPGPVNRGVEIASEVADGSHSVILEQVSNGVAVRMALLYLLIGGTKT